MDPKEIAREVLFFDNMLTPKIITAIYWMMLLGALIMGISNMFSGGSEYGGRSGVSFQGVVMGFVYIIGGAIGSRIWCELMIVLFKMNEALQVIRNK
jgi:hypothetical protein